MEHTLYYSPYSAIATVNYGLKNDEKIVCIDGKCNLPDTTISEDGQLKLQGFHDYPLKGKIKITGAFYKLIPIYGYKYYRCIKEVNPLSGIEHIEIIEELTNEQLQEFEEEHGYLEVGINYTNNGIIQKDKFVEKWIKSEPFRYENENFNFSRDTFVNNKYIFRGYYNIRSIKIKPITEEKINNYNSDSVKLVTNDMSCYINGFLNFDNDADLNKMGMLGVILKKHISFHFNQFGLDGGTYNNYKVTIVDNKPEHISF